MRYALKNMARWELATVALILMASAVGAALALGNGSDAPTPTQTVPPAADIEDPVGVTYPVLQLERVIDGDTYEMWLQLAPRMAYFADVRLAGVDTPETRGDCSDEADRVTERIRQFLEDADTLIARPTDVDSFGRYVAAVTVDGQDLAEWIRDEGLTKGDLCDG